MQEIREVTLPSLSLLLASLISFDFPQKCLILRLGKLMHLKLDESERRVEHFYIIFL